MGKSRVLYFYQYKKQKDSPCLECGSKCNTIIELRNNNDFICCGDCARRKYKFKKSNRKTPPQTRKEIFRQNTRIKKRENEVLE